MTLSTVHRLNYTCWSSTLHPYYTNPALTSGLFVHLVSFKWQDVLISLAWLDVISLARSCVVVFLFFFFFFFFLCIKAQCPAETSACIQTLRLTLNWPLCLLLQIQIIYAGAVHRHHGNKDHGCQEFTVCFGLESKYKWRWGWTGQSRRWCGLTWDGRGDTTSQGTQWLCPKTGGLDALVHLWGKRSVFLTTSALSSSQHASPDPDKICIRHSLQHDPTPFKLYHTPPQISLFTLAHKAELHENRYSVLFLMWQYQQFSKYQ